MVPVFFFVYVQDEEIDVVYGSRGGSDAGLLSDSDDAENIAAALELSGQVSVCLRYQYHAFNAPDEKRLLLCTVADINV